jgi:hypothetical protein
MKIRLTALLLPLTLVHCDPEPAPPVTPQPGAPTPTPAATPTGEASKYFPLQSGHIYQYVTESDGGQGVMMTRVTRADGKSGDLQGPRGTKTFEYVTDGVVLTTGGAPIYVLKLPLAVGTKWRGQGGSSVEIVEVGATVTVPAGTYQQCIKTVEQRGGDQPMRVATTYCPDTGIVELEAASGAAMERAVLKSYGPPVDLGPDGLRAIPPPKENAPTPPP